MADEEEEEDGDPFEEEEGDSDESEAEDDSVLGSIAAAAAQAAVAAVAQFDLGEVAAAAAASAATAATLAALQASGLNGCINPKNPRQAAATALQLSGVKLIENETDENSFDLQRHVDAIRMPSPPVTLEPKQTAFLEDCLRICHRSFEPEGDSFLSCVTFQPETSETGRHPLLIAPRELAGLTWEVPQDRLIEMSLFDEERYNGDRLLINDKQLLQLYRTQLTLRSSMSVSCTRHSGSLVLTSRG
jgi:hypothetical protein